MIFAFGARRKVCGAKERNKAINKLCVREILSLSFVCGAYFFQFRGRNLVCFVIAYNFNGKYAPEAGKTRMRTAFFTRALAITFSKPIPKIAPHLNRLSLLRLMKGELSW